jgi:hypothetical protein
VLNSSWKMNRWCRHALFFEKAPDAVQCPVVRAEPFAVDDEIRTVSGLRCGHADIGGEHVELGAEHPCRDVGVRRHARDVGVTAARQRLDQLFVGLERVVRINGTIETGTEVIRERTVGLDGVVVQWEAKEWNW